MRWWLPCSLILAACSESPPGEHAAPPAITPKPAPTATAEPTATAQPAPTPTAEPRLALSPAPSPPRVYALLTVGRRVFAFDDAPTARRPKKPLGTATARVILGGTWTMREGLAWLTDPEPAASPADFTVARPASACLDTGRQRVLFGFREAGKPAGDEEWYEPIELSACAGSAPASDKSYVWFHPDLAAAPGAFGEFEWRGVAVEGKHPEARYAFDLQRIEGAEAAPLRRRLADHLASPANTWKRYEERGDQGTLWKLPPFKDVVLAESTVSTLPRPAPAVRDVAAMRASLHAGMSTDILRIMTADRTLEVQRFAALQGLLSLGDRRFVIAGAAELDPPLRVLEIGADRMLDAGGMAGVRPSAGR